MNTAHLHLIFTHFPIAGLGFALLFNMFAIIRKNRELMSAAFWFYILVGLSALLAVLTGDGAGEILKTYPGISTDAIENHETWGYVLFYTLLANAVLAAAALWFTRKNRDVAVKFSIALLIIAFVAVIFTWQAGITGGNLRHPEITLGDFKK